MKAAQMKIRPDFMLMKQTDVQSIYYMQMPRWLFSDPRYADLSLDAQECLHFLPSEGDRGAKMQENRGVTEKQLRSR